MYECIIWSLSMLLETIILNLVLACSLYFYSVENVNKICTIILWMKPNNEWEKDFSHKNMANKVF